MHFIYSPYIITSMVSARKREGEPQNSLVFRFTKKVRRSGVILETRGRRAKGRPISRRKRRVSAIFKAGKRVEMARQKKFGVI